MDQPTGVEEDWEDGDDWLAREPAIAWAQYIHEDPNVLLGKPVVKGTRLSVEFILDLYAAGWTEQQVLERVFIKRFGVRVCEAVYHRMLPRSSPRSSPSMPRTPY